MTATTRVFESAIDARRFGLSEHRTNNHVALNAAIEEAAGRGGGRVVIPPGTFHVTEPVYLKSYVDLVGMGWSSILKVAPGTTQEHIEVVGSNYSWTSPIVTTDPDDEVTGASLQNFQLDGNAANQDVGQDHFSCAYLRNTYNCSVIDMYMHDVGNMVGSLESNNRSACLIVIGGRGLTVRGGYYARAGYECIGIRGIDEYHHADAIIQGVRLRHGNVHCLAFQPGARRIVASDLIIDNREATWIGQGHGITCHGSTDIVIDNAVMRVKNAGFRALDRAARIRASRLHAVSIAEALLDPVCYIFAGGGTPPTDVTVSDSYFESGPIVSRAAVEIEGANNVTLDNVVGVSDKESRVHECFRVTSGASNVRINGGSSKSWPTKPGVFIYGGSTNVTVTGHTVNGGTGGIAVSASTGASNVTVDKCDLSSVTTPLSGFNTTGGGRTVRNNIGAATESKVSGTIESGTTSIAIDHGLTAWRTLTTADFQPYYVSDPNGAGQLYISTVTSTQVTVSCTDAPAGDVDIAVRCDATRDQP